MTTTIINLTPHQITIGDLTIPPSGKIARALEERLECPSIAVTTPNAVREVPTATVCHTGLIDLPDPQPGVLLVVSVVAAFTARQHRPGGYVGDLLVPGDQLRDDVGRVVGCRCLYWVEAPVLDRDLEDRESGIAW